MSDYVNGKELTQELRVYREKYLSAMESGLEKPQISDTISRAIIQIATRLANSHNFVRYPFREEMIGDGIFKCLNKVHLFNPEVSENSFAYFTQICWNEAIKRIKEEKYEMSIKAKYIREKMSSDFVSHGVDSDSDDGSNSFVEFLKENDCYVDYIAQKKLEEVDMSTQNKHTTHRNKTTYKKKDTPPPTIEDIFDLSVFEEDEEQ